MSWLLSPAGGVAALSLVGDVTITSIAANELLQWNGTAWINQTLAEMGIGAEVNDLTAAVTWANVPDANITVGSVTQHVASIDHDALLNFLTAEHVDWAGASAGTVHITNFAALQNLSEDASPTLGADLGLASSDITGVGNINTTGNITCSGDLEATDLNLDDSAPAITLQISSVTSAAITAFTTSLVFDVGGQTSAWLFNFQRDSNSMVTIDDANGLTIFESGAAELDFLRIQLDGTDVNFTHNNVTDWNITGVTAIQAGTVDADFDAITATSYGGVLEANLVDKTAAETLSGILTISASPLFDSGSIFIKEGSADEASVAAYGQFFVLDNAPNRPWFTDDADTPMPLSFAALTNVAEDTDDVCDFQYMNGIYFKDGTVEKTLTLEASSVNTFKAGAMTAIVNAGASANIVITEGASTTLWLIKDGSVTDTAGGCTLGPAGYATLYRHSATVYYIMGDQLTA